MQRGIILQDDNDIRAIVLVDSVTLIFDVDIKTDNSCNNNPHTLCSRQDIYSSSQSLRE